MFTIVKNPVLRAFNFLSFLYFIIKYFVNLILWAHDKKKQLSSFFNCQQKVAFNHKTFMLYIQSEAKRSPENSVDNKYKNELNHRQLPYHAIILAPSLCQLAQFYTY